MIHDSGSAFDTPPGALEPADDDTPPESSWATLAAEYESKMTDAERQALADSLGVPVDATHQLQVGVCERKRHGTTFTFAEMDSGGNVIGINRRYPNGEKLLLKGGKRGLYVPLGWEDCGGCVYLVEGASDTLALSAAGLSAIGRPDCSGGGKHLVELLAECQREIVVVGENDDKPDGSCPGREGAENLARTLCRALKRPITVAFPPPDAKDVRAWLTHPDRAGLSWLDRGAELRNLLADAATITANPPPVIWPSCRQYETTSQAIAALAAEPTVYSRCGVLVTVDPTPQPFDPAPPTAKPLNKDNLQGLLSRCAEWWVTKEKKGEEIEVQIPPPTWCTAQVLSRGVYPGIRPLSAVVEHPVLLPGGECLTESGYHAGTGVLAQIPPDLRLAVPTNPTADDVLAARDTLLEPFCDFPFIDDISRSAIVAALITPLAFHAFNGPAPFFLVDKNTRGTGSGLLMEVLGLILTGRPMTPSPMSGDKEEFSKAMTTIAVAGRPFVLFDNLTGTLGGACLDMVLTATSFSNRLLGLNQDVFATLRTVWYGTGNNVKVGDDTLRRVCRIRMETSMERPETRTGFRYPDLPSHVLEHRSQYLTAALTILRGWYAAGCPRAGATLGSFGGWAGVVGEAIIHAGLANPCDAIMSETATIEVDTETAAMGVLFAHWREFDPFEEGKTASEILAVSQGPVRQTERWRAELQEAIGELLGDKPTPGSLGYTLRRYHRRNVGGYVLDAIINPRAANRWVVRRVEGGLQ